MHSINPIIETTDDGSQTLRHPVFGDTYHSTRGAVGESRHVFLEAGFRWWLDAQAEKNKNNLSLSQLENRSPKILEMGFGSGLNAYLTLLAAREAGVRVEYVGVELYPVAVEVAQQLQYSHDGFFVALHETPWNRSVNLTDTFSLCKWQGAIAEYPFNATFDLIYFDAFAPETQPELWTRALFDALYASLNVGGALLTYSAKGVVKEQLRAAGFTVRRLAGALGKRHMVRAEKDVKPL